MRRGLVWALAAAGLLSAVALWLDDKPGRVVAAVSRTDPPPRSVESPAPAAPAAGPLPRELAPILVEPARRDIFAAVEPPAPKASPPPPPPPAPVIAPPPPAPPSLSLRYLGAMITPTGERLVLLARGDASIPVQVGTRLEEGYVVESIGTDSIRLFYPPLGSVVDIPIPPAPPARQ